MKRRDFIALASSAALWNFAAKAQPAVRARRICVLMGADEHDRVARSWLQTFSDVLQKQGWKEGHTLKIDYRWTDSDAKLTRAYAAELVGLSPDVLLAHGTPPLVALHRVTSSIPIVFVRAAGVLEAGLVKSFARPENNITGFINFEYTIGGKWLELVKQLAPNTVQIGVVVERGNSSGGGYFQAIQSASSSTGVTVSALMVASEANLKSSIESFSRQPYGALIVLPSGIATTHSRLIVDLAAEARLPAIYPYRSMADAGGLASYGINTRDLYSRAAGYVARILAGEKPGELPVQAPTQFESVLNLRTAKALGLKIPDSLQQLADEVIE